MVDLSRKYQHIIWDWNGTLLNDVSIVVEAMNTMLIKRGLPLLDIARYKEIFTFPVREYYFKLGFDFEKEPFEILAAEFISEFDMEKYSFKLFDGVEQVISDLKSAGIKQYILSATQQSDLENAVGTFKIASFFDRISGLDNHYAASKIEVGIALLDELRLNPKRVLLVGDTLHDFEVSRALQCDCLLVCNGHQSYDRISESKANIINDISEIISFLT